MSTVLIIDKFLTIPDAFTNHTINTKIVHTNSDAIVILNNEKVDVVIIDVDSGVEGLDFIKSILDNYNSEVIMISIHNSKVDYMKAISLGISDFMIKPINSRELIGRVQKAIQSRQVKQENQKYLKLLRTLVTTDDLTQLKNSRQFNIDIDKECKRASRLKHPLSLIFMDIDDFKIFNDTYGHVEGDTVLRTVGRVIKDNLRGIDSAYRYGGEEFTIILPETSLEKSRIVANRIRKLIEQENFKPHDYNVNVTVSIGLSEFKDSETSTEFVQRSDEAMYASKEAGKNRITVL